jgi:hypothetical protein
LTAACGCTLLIEGAILMPGTIFLIQDNGQLVEMKEHSYDSEDILQTLIANYPNLLAGDQINASAPRKWLLISREASVPAEEGRSGRWFIDHLFLDQDAIPTLVEVKRSSDTRVRREVVGQMLDYAANAVVYWPVEQIRSNLEARCQREGLDIYQLLNDFLDSDKDPEQFWQDVKTNLQAGRVRLIFVADIIPQELRRIVEFLNTQMDPAEVLAVEVKQYVGEGLKNLVPRVMGLTAEAQQKKQPTSNARQWDESSFMAELESRQGPDAVAIARKLLEWGKASTSRIWWGKGSKDGSFFPIYDENGTGYLTLFSVWTYGRIEIQFQFMKGRPPFDSEPKRQELLQRLNQISGVQIPADGINRRPSFSLALLKNQSALKHFLETFDWVIDVINSSVEK